MSLDVQIQDFRKRKNIGVFMGISWIGRQSNIIMVQQFLLQNAISVAYNTIHIITIVFIILFVGGKKKSFQDKEPREGGCLMV